MLATSVRSLVLSLAILNLAQGRLVAAPYTPPANNRVDFNMNADWKFIMEDADGASAAGLRRQGMADREPPPYL